MSRDRFVEERLPTAADLPDFLSLDYPPVLNAAAELLTGGAPDALAIVNSHGRWTYAELDAFSGRIARLLVEQEAVVQGNRVLLRGPNGYTLFAAWPLAGLTWVIFLGEAFVHDFRVLAGRDAR